MAVRNVKRVSKTRSNNKPRRPKQEKPPESRRIAAENADFMTAAAKLAVAPEAAAVPAVPEAAAVKAVPARIVLGVSCTIHEAAALRAHLLDKSAHPGPYEIDGSGVQHIDTAGLQLVVAFALDCLERSIHYVWTGRSAVLEEAIRTLGVGALLESPGGA
jgi:phospholipid transport system transporter-binding protein